MQRSFVYMQALKDEGLRAIRGRAIVASDVVASPSLAAHEGTGIGSDAGPQAPADRSGAAGSASFFDRSTDRNSDKTPPTARPPPFTTDIPAGVPSSIIPPVPPRLPIFLAALSAEYRGAVMRV